MFFTSPAQPFFELKFGTALDDRARAVQQLSDGYIYVAGFSNAGTNGGYDVSLSKISQSGILIWTKYYGKQYDEYALFMTKTADDFLILCGETHTPFSGVDAWIMKIDSTGDAKWTSGITTSLNESFKFVETTIDGGYITCGFQSDSFASNDVLIARFDSVGDFLWQKTFGGTDNDYADAIRKTADGGYIISADTRSFGLSDYDIWMIKTDSAGNYLWDNFSGGPYADGCQGFIITSNHNILTFGESFTSLALPYQFFLQLADSSGNVIWEKYPGAELSTDAGFSAVETADGGFIITGYSNAGDINFPIDLVVFKINSQGDSLWSQYYGGPGIDLGYHIIDCIGGGYIIAGTTWQNDNDYYLLKVDDSGLTDIELSQVTKNKFKVYPNPSDGEINIELEQAIINPEVKIITDNGQKVFSLHLKGIYSSLKINPVLTQGKYILEIRDKNGFNARQQIFIRK